MKQNKQRKTHKPIFECTMEFRGIFPKKIAKNRIFNMKKMGWLPEKIIWRPLVRNLRSLQLKANKSYRKLIQEVSTSEAVMGHLSPSGKALQTIPALCFPSAHHPSSSDPLSCPSFPSGNVSQLPGHFKPIPCCHLIWHRFSHPEGSQGHWHPTDSSPLCCN